MLLFDSTHCGSVWRRCNLLKLHLSMYLFILNFNSGFDMFIWKTKRASFVVLLLSESCHRLSVILMRCWDMRELFSCENFTISVAETPTWFWLVEVLQSFILDIIKRNWGSSGLNWTESLIFPKSDRRYTISQCIWRLKVLSYDSLSWFQKLKSMLLLVNYCRSFRF